MTEKLFGFFDSLGPTMAWVGLWVGLVSFTLGLSFLLWTRWGYYHLIAKCALFSFIAHLVLGLFFATAEVVDSVVVALAPVNQPKPLTVDVMLSANDDAPIDAAPDGRSEGSFPAASWDRALDTPVIEPATIEREAQMLESAPRDERSPIERPELATEPPQPELPIGAVPVEPRLAQSEPESPEFVEKLTVPEEVTARTSDIVEEALPGENRTQRMPTFEAGMPARNRSPGSSPDSTESGPVTVAPRLDRLPPDANFVPSAPARAIMPEVDAGAGDKTGELSVTTTPVIVSPPLIAKQDAPGAGAAKEARGPQPSTISRGPLSIGSISGTATKPTRSDSSRGTESDVALPSTRLIGPGTSLNPSTSVSNAAVRPVAPGGMPGGVPGGSPTGSPDGSGLRLGTPDIYRARMNPNRSEQAVTRGGSRASEAAVERSLAWLAAHQSKDGRWDADGFHAQCPPGTPCSGSATQNRDDCAVTGMVLLAFLGAGHTHQNGTYAANVRNGVNWLLAQEKPSGDFRGTGKMYSQGIAALALSETLGMTGDPQLRGPVERAVNFIVAAQNPTTGGWRYLPGQYGDTSIYGWQLMALKSASLAGVPVPDSTWQKARLWFDIVGSGKARGLASYTPGEPPTPVMTAEALACRLFLGTPADDPAVREAADYILQFPPQWNRLNMYYWYYGTVASFQIGGDSWERWNAALRDPLIRNQVRDGHLAGSWDPTGDPWGREGGRLYSTALATLCLEVYYRFLPIQSLSAYESAPSGPASPRPAEPVRQTGAP